DMAAEKTETCYQDCCVDSFMFYLEHSGEHQAILQTFRLYFIISLHVYSLFAGQVDVQILTLLQSILPGIQITSDVVEGSIKLTDNFKALVAKTANLKNVQFHWHIMSSEDYEKQVKAVEHVKKFDLIHMIQMIYYVGDLAATIQFYHGLLKKNGRLMIIVETANGGWDTLWKTHKNDLCTHTITEYRSSGEVKACLDKLGLKYDEHPVPNTFDISECFNPKSKLGCDLLNFMTAKDDFHASFTPEIREAILNVLKNKCSTQKDGKIMFNSNLSCILIHA
uniref:Histamine N-methyltransferase n=1 Tax=Periophthalmus magnuspinnatus TaxID=409849 RepID=A0A3B3ZIV4_9GOBI